MSLLLDPLHLTSTPTVTALQTPKNSQLAKAARFSPDGTFVIAHVDSYDDTIESGWQQAVVWRVSDQSIVLSTTTDATPFSGSAFVLPNQLFSFLQPAGQKSEGVASWSF